MYSLRHDHYWKFGHRHGFSLWPLILLGVVGFVFAGPVLHLAAFMIKLAIGLLPFALMFGLGVWFARHKSGHKFGWERAEKSKRPAYSEDGSEIFYV